MYSTDGRPRRQETSRTDQANQEYDEVPETNTIRAEPLSFRANKDLTLQKRTILKDFKSENRLFGVPASWHNVRPLKAGAFPTDRIV